MASMRPCRQATVRLLVLFLATAAVWSVFRLTYSPSTPLLGSGSLVEHRHQHNHHVQLQSSHLIQTTRDSSSHAMNNVSGADYADFDVVKNENATLLMKELSNKALSSVQLPELEHFREKLPSFADYSVIGRQRSTKGYLTIGVPSVYRSVMGNKYLRLTLDSLLSSIPPSEMDNIVIIVFIGDLDTDKRHNLKQAVVSRYPDQLNSGLLQVVTVNVSVYPPLENLKRNYGDEPDRVRWRSKLVIDFAYMFHYGAPLSQYYMQIEDDVITAPNFTTVIRQCIKQHKQWTVLEFSVLGFIGKLFRSEDLERLARFFAMFYDEMPADFLYIHFMRVLAQQSDTIHCRPSIFQHLGKFSSLAGRGPNLLKDATFLGDSEAAEKSAEHALLGGNPPAEVYSTIKHHLDHGPRNAYEATDKYFWGLSPKANDIYCVLFKDFTDIDVVEIFTAHDAHGGDYLRGGVVLVSPEGHAEPSIEPQFAGQTVCKCQPWVQVGSVFSGDFTARDLSKSVGFKVKCLQIKVTVNQTEWVVIKQVRVTSNHW